MGNIQQATHIANDNVPHHSEQEKQSCVKISKVKQHPTLPDEPTKKIHKLIAVFGERVTSKAKFKPKNTDVHEEPKYAPPAPPAPPTIMDTKPKMATPMDRDALFKSIKNGIQLRTVDRQPIYNTTQETQDMVYQDDLLNSFINKEQCKKIAEQMAIIIYDGMSVDWEKIVTEKLGHYETKEKLAHALPQMSKEIQDYWSIFSCVPDLINEPHTRSDQTTSTKNIPSVVKRAFSRFNSAPSTRTFRVTDHKNQVTLSNKDAMRSKANRLANNTLNDILETKPNKKLDYIGDHYKQAALNVFESMPFIQGDEGELRFEKQNGKINMDRLRRDFMANIKSKESMKNDIIVFLNTQLTEKFKSYTTLGLLEIAGLSPMTID
ncbi:hypothetical protein [Vibrio anguillarum]|uniref:hypothetical protein n=1 Tax=Vibrio anguillarum TaxID=55601 RepID=UPI00097E28FB|nr:hypothetical protein [Vibrio anguillarum]AQM21432.1 hypothetical protein PN51_16650 [Vibrio anguillarum]AUB86201.1 hypothetical protein CKY00_02490 [Vibrio anguillarum]AUB89639.1 hypothetical protein CKX99_02490 [Vibrio anguillarum]AUB93081.1 hypothetical protein CK210_02490 [Vibrio anguillarum]AUB96513.1 hypothetical protein CK209_02490 [Vibrio anguillarum]